VGLLHDFLVVSLKIFKDEQLNANILNNDIAELAQYAAEKILKPRLIQQRNSFGQAEKETTERYLSLC
jgi:hypothetical protein